MSVKFGCKCDERNKPVQERQWEVLLYRCNHAASNGNRFTPSDYSTVHCQSCGQSGRTNAAYVDDLYRRDNRQEESNVDISSVIALSRQWRETSSAQRGGVVMVLNGEVLGWAEKLYSPGDWSPGCIAVDVKGRCWEAIQSNTPQSLQWIPLEIPTLIANESKERSGVTLSAGVWGARHGSTTVNFSITKYGPGAKRLAEDAYQKLLNGEWADEAPRDDALGRYEYPMALAARELNMTQAKLWEWILTGVVDGRKVRPPARASRKDFIAGFELHAAIERLKEATKAPKPADNDFTF